MDTSPAGGRLVALARLYDDCVHLVVSQDGPIHTLADLRGRRVSVGGPGSGTAITAAHILSVAGLDGSDVHTTGLDLDHSVEALTYRRIDGFFFSGGPPVKAISDLATDWPIRLVPLVDQVPAMVAGFGEYYEDRVVPAGAYSGVDPVQTIGIPNHLVVLSTMDRDLAYRLTKLLFDGAGALSHAHPAGAQLNIRAAITTTPLPLHPGAIDYYRSVKP